MRQRPSVASRPAVRPPFSLAPSTLTLHEFLMREPIPLARVHEVVLEFLSHRDDVVLFGAQAVNAYTAQPRMSQGVDLLSTRAQELAEELRSHLNARLEIAIRVRAVKAGLGYRLFQVKKPANRHLVDVRSVPFLPEHRQIETVRVLAPVQLIVYKLASLVGRRATPKGATDLADLRRLLLAFPDLKAIRGQVSSRLRETDATKPVLAAWRDLVAQEIVADDEDADF